MSQDLPLWPNSRDYEFVGNFDQYGNAHPLVGYQYKMEADYLRAWKAAAEARMIRAGILIEVGGGAPDNGGASNG